MTTVQTDETKRQIRLWPGVAIVLVQLVARFGVPAVWPEMMMIGMLVALAGALGILLWWLFFSRAPWSERLGALVLMTGAVLATPLILHESIATAGMGYLFPFLVPLTLSVAFVAWAVLCRRLSDGLRWATMAAAILIGTGGWALLRTGGITGEGGLHLAWRWTATPEERLLARAADEAMAALPPAPVAVEAEAEWPGFRGPGRDSIIRGARVGTDWAASPPAELWRRPIGPGWSSFAVHGDLIYTQEQRGDDEVVACYKAATGEPVWIHGDAARFWEANAGAGPRATPTLSGGRVYTFGATGILNVLDARDGGVVWSRNAAADTGVKVPDWGFASSPLVLDDLVVVATGGALAAYDLASGEPRWFGPKSGWGYSSPHRVTIDGVEQIVLLNGAGAIAVGPTDGTVLWEHKWPGDGIVQPALTTDGDVLIGTGSGMGAGAGIGVRRIAVARGPGGWTTEERWTSAGLKPYFNDYVVHEGHAYGFDGGILSCIGLDDGERRWKGGRFGHGQLVLLPDQDLLLVVSEQGELALVGATPGGFTEHGRFPAVQGKTWNHPVLVGDLLLVRNGQEMVAFRLALATG